MFRASSLGLAFTLLLGLSGCGGGGEGPAKGAAGDNRPKEQVQNDDMMQKAVQNSTQKRR